MRNILYLSIVVSLLSACASNEKLDREKVFTILQEKSEFPKDVAEEIYVADPEEVKKILDSGLEKEGLLTVQRTQNLADVGKPLISFTDRARPFLLPQTEKDKKNSIQRVKIADQTLKKVTGVRMLDGNKKAIVEYKVAFMNITPFAKLSQIDLSKEKTVQVNFLLYDDGWRIDK